jgi:hypothetical protein
MLKKNYYKQKWNNAADAELRQILKTF